MRKNVLPATSTTLWARPTMPFSHIRRRCHPLLFFWTNQVTAHHVALSLFWTNQVTAWGSMDSHWLKYMGQPIRSKLNLIYGYKYWHIWQETSVSLWLLPQLLKEVNPLALHMTLAWIWLWSQYNFGMNMTLAWIWLRPEYLYTCIYIHLPFVKVTPFTTYHQLCKVLTAW